MLNLECSKLYVHIIKLYEKQHHMVEQTALLSLRKHYEAEVCLLPKQLIFSSVLHQSLIILVFSVVPVKDG